MLFIVTDKFSVGRAQRDHINIRIFAFDMRLKYAVILAALSEPCKNTPDNLARCGSMAIEQASADKCSAAALFIAAHRRRVHVYDGMVKRADDYGLAVGVDDRAEELGELKSGGGFVCRHIISPFKSKPRRCDTARHGVRWGSASACRTMPRSSAAAGRACRNYVFVSLSYLSVAGD